MDDFEKMLFRRRKPYISDIVQLNSDIIGELRAVGLLTADVIAMLQLEKTNQTKVGRLVDHLVGLKAPSNIFSLFCQTLGHWYKWLVRDLIADLKVERGDVKPKPETTQEAAALVHRRFGTSKRFSETDKKDMAELIAIKLQIADDEWQQETDKIKYELNESTERLTGRDQLAQEIYDMERTFIRQHRKQLETHAHDMRTTREFIERILDQEVPPGGVNPLCFIKERLDGLFKQMSTALNQHDSLHYEKEKALRLLGINDPKVALDTAISKLTGLHLVGSNMETEDKAVTIRKLQQQVAELEDQLEESDVKMDEYQLQLDERDRELSKLRRMVTID